MPTCLASVLEVGVGVLGLTGPGGGGDNPEQTRDIYGFPCLVLPLGGSSSPSSLATGFRWDLLY